MNRTTRTALLAMAMALAATTQAQVAGTRRLGATTTVTEQVIAGWSVKQSILGRMVYDASGDKLGRARDLIVDTDQRVSFLIVDMGGAAPANPHLVAVAASPLQVRGARLVLPGVTRQALASQPAFVYAPITRTQSSVVERAQRDIDRARLAIARLEGGAESPGEAAGAERRSLAAALREQLQAVDNSIAAMDTVDVAQWQAAEAEVARASAKLRAVMRDAPI